ncbi:MAG: hypothetical protein ACI9T9_002130 [Oleiphilaceae bacterium]
MGVKTLSAKERGIKQNPIINDNKILIYSNFSNIDL